MSGPFGSSQFMYATGALAEGSSLRFEDGDSAYLSFTPASAGNTKTWTWSGWVKRGNLGGFQNLFLAGTSGSSYTTLYFSSSNTFEIQQLDSSTQNLLALSTAVFRDPSAWYHVVLAYDSTQATNSNGVKLYINGVQQTLSFTTYSQNNSTYINSSVSHGLGTNPTITSNNFDGYLANVTFIDGQQLDATSFGEYEDTLWKPKSDADITSLTMGTNGFYLPFKQTTEAEGFSTVTYTGNGSTQGIEGVGFEPDFVWIKSRNATYNNNVFDSVRGVEKYLLTDSTLAENGGTSGTGSLTSFDASGFSLGSQAYINNSGTNYVAWCWDAGTGSAVSNTDGSVTSTVKANTANGFSIVSWTATNGAATIGHGLNSAPEMIIVKDRDSVVNWTVYHGSLGNTGGLVLNATNSFGANINYWNNTSPTSSVFSVGSFSNYLTDDHIAYCFHSVSGYSDFGSYTGNGSTSGPTVTTGFKPAFVMIKRTDSTSGWTMFDNTRNVDGLADKEIYANDSAAEAIGSSNYTSTSTGFDITTTNSWVNASGGTYIYMAFKDTRDATFFGDTSGNGNNWTPNALNNTDVVPDSPVTNFASWNPIEDDTKFATSNQGLMTLSEGNLKYSGTRNAFSTFSVTSGKYYWEINNISSTTTSTAVLGVLTQDARGSIYGVYYNAVNGKKGLGTLNSGVTESTYGATFTDGDIIGVALNMDDDEVTFYKNGTSQGVISASSLSGKPVSAWVQNGGNTGTMVGIANFGQDSSFAGNETPQGNTDDNGQGDFYHAPPSGFLALNRNNLPSPDILDPADYFNTVLYTGNATSQSITGVGFEPDWVWAKARNAVAGHRLYDVVRGATKELYSNATNAEATDTTSLTSFDSDGFSVGSDTTMNGSGRNIVAWNWLAGGTAVSNTDGSITSQVSANTDAGFSVVSYDSNPSGTVGHGLSQAPELIIEKKRDATGDWIVGTTVIDGSYDFLRLNTTAAKANAVVAAPTATVFTHNVGSDSVIAYCFHSVESYSKCGVYTGNGSTDGVYVHCGFRPAWIMVKRTDSAADWLMFDAKRDIDNEITKFLYPNLSNAEATGSGVMDFLSNGFKLRGSTANRNASGGTYIFLAFAEAPFKNANAR